MTAMHQTTIIFLTLLLCTHVHSQDSDIEFDVAKPSTNRLFIEDFAYPEFFTGEQHSWFKIGYQVADRFLLEIQGFYDTYRAGSRFRMPILAKNYFGKKAYFFSGIEYEFALGQTSNELSPAGDEIPKLKPRLGYIGGVGYDINEDFMIETKTNFQINESKLQTLGQGQGKNVLTLGSKFKF